MNEIQSDTQLIDNFGRTINYLRLSVTDRCNLRCVYCMAENMQFLPKAKLLSFEEITLICRAMSELGVRKIRLTGGEPLVRNDIVNLATHIAELDGIEELAITTNGARLKQLAKPLFQSGVDRLNISLDTLDSNEFTAITRTGKLSEVLDGISAAKDAGFRNIKLNAVILKGQNDEQVLKLLEFIIINQLDVSFIEEMPLGEIDSHDRENTFFSSAEVKQIIQSQHQLLPSTANTGGPSKYFSIPGHAGFISPLSSNFCSSCNRIRITAEGQLLLCLGNENPVDLRAVVRRSPGQHEVLKRILIDAIKLKPKSHNFGSDQHEHIVRFMNMTGG